MKTFTIQKAIVTNKKIGKYEALRTIKVKPAENYYKLVMLVAEQAGYKEERQSVVRIVEDRKIVWLGKFPNEKQIEINLRKSK